MFFFLLKLTAIAYFAIYLGVFSLYPQYDVAITPNYFLHSNFAWFSFFYKNSFLIKPFTICCGNKRRFYLLCAKVPFFFHIYCRYVTIS